MNNDIRFYRPAVSETIARNTLNAFDPHILWGKPGPVPIEQMVEKIGLVIDHQYLRKNDRILGETVFEDAEIPIYDMIDHRYTTIFVKADTILLDAHLLESDHEGRLRYTLTHELSHWILHRNLYLGSDYLAAMVNAPAFDGTAFSSDAEQGVERQADMLATALLMPIVKVKQAVYAMQRCGMNRDELIASMARLFNVSRQAMRIRLERHNLI